MNDQRFQLLTPAAEPLVKRFFAGYFTESCERSWVNLQLYMDSYQWHYAVVDERLFIVSFLAGYCFYPVGKSTPPEELHKLISGTLSCDTPRMVCGDIPEDYINEFPSADQYLPITSEPGEYDYIYDLEHLSGFSGERLRKRHNQVRQFERNYAGMYTVKSITADNIESVRQWALLQNQARGFSETLEEENRALGLLSGRWQDPAFALDGIVLEIDGETAGFSVFSPLSKTLADIHFEKSDRRFRGAGAMVTAQLVEYLRNKDFRAMNREQDLNIESLRQAKQALDPAHYFKRSRTELLLQ